MNVQRKVVLLGMSKEPMEHKKAAEILIKLLDKHSLDVDEKEAVKMAIGVLGWTSLAQSKLKDRADRNRSVDKKQSR